jgi:hypothetical protein
VWVQVVNGASGLAAASKVITEVVTVAAAIVFLAVVLGASFAVASWLRRRVRGG